MFFDGFKHFNKFFFPRKNVQVKNCLKLFFLQVIRLKQKRHQSKMQGAYRNVEIVNDMCNRLDEYDYENMDLFPCGELLCSMPLFL